MFDFHVMTQRLFAEQMITALFLHSDNAAQHFKSSKSLHWLSKQMKGMGFISLFR